MESAWLVVCLFSHSMGRYEEFDFHKESGSRFDRLFVLLDRTIQGVKDLGFFVEGAGGLSVSRPFYFLLQPSFFGKQKKQQQKSTTKNQQQQKNLFSNRISSTEKFFNLHFFFLLLLWITFL
jgi:hypothetical protein